MHTAVATHDRCESVPPYGRARRHGLPSPPCTPLDVRPSGRDVPIPPRQQVEVIELGSTESGSTTDIDTPEPPLSGDHPGVPRSPSVWACLFDECALYKAASYAWLLCGARMTFATACTCLRARPETAPPRCKPSASPARSLRRLPDHHQPAPTGAATRRQAAGAHGPALSASRPRSVHWRATRHALPHVCSRPPCFLPLVLPG